MATYCSNPLSQPACHHDLRHRPGDCRYPRTTLLQSLEAILVVELADNACWETLGALAQEAGEDNLVSRCKQAQATEKEHLIKVHTWVAAGQGLA